MLRRNVVDVTYLLFFFFYEFSISANQLLKLKIIFSHLWNDFAKCLRTCYSDQNLNIT